MNGCIIEREIRFLKSGFVLVIGDGHTQLILKNASLSP